MLDNQKLVPQPHVPPVIVLENHGLRWVPKDKNLVMWRDWEESRQMVGALLEVRKELLMGVQDSFLGK